MSINTVAVTLSVLGVLNAITGTLVHNAGSVLVALNAALFYDRKLVNRLYSARQNMTHLIINNRTFH